MSNINVTVDVSKIDKSKITDFEYTDKDGNKHSKKEVKLVLRELKTGPVVVCRKDGTPVQGDDWVLKKTHIVTQDGEDMPIIGNAVIFDSKQASLMKDQMKEKEAKKDILDNFDDEINPDDVPF